MHVVGVELVTVVQPGEALCAQEVNESDGGG